MLLPLATILTETDRNLIMQAFEKEPICKAYTYVTPPIQGGKAQCKLKDEVPDKTLQLVHSHEGFSGGTGKLSSGKERGSRKMYAG